MVEGRGQNTIFNEDETKVLWEILPHEKFFKTEGLRLMRLVCCAILEKVKGKEPFRAYPCKSLEIFHFAPLRNIVSKDTYDVFRVSLLGLPGEIHYVYIVVDTMFPINGLLKARDWSFRLRGISYPVFKSIPAHGWFGLDEIWYFWSDEPTGFNKTVASQAA